MAKNEENKKAKKTNIKSDTAKTATKKVTSSTKKTTSKPKTVAKKDEVKSKVALENKKEEKLEKEVTQKAAKSTTVKKATSKSSTTTKKSTVKASEEKKVESNKETKKASASKSKKADTKKTTNKSSKTPKSATSKKVDTKAKSSKAKKTSSKVANSKLDNSSTVKPMLAEYYDLPYRYNQTIVKILAQTPTTLFIYWDISDDDRNALVNKYGENFFYETRPILLVHNLTYNYTFEIEINDFANSWYIRTQESNCNYNIELGRKYNNINNEYIYINSSNNMISPNDHVLFENANLGNVVFKNVKTNTLSSKNFGSLRFMTAMDKLYGNIYDVYSALYDGEILNELKLPSSGEFYLKKWKEENK